MCTQSHTRAKNALGLEPRTLFKLLVAALSLACQATCDTELDTLYDRFPTEMYGGVGCGGVKHVPKNRQQSSESPFRRNAPRHGRGDQGLIARRR